MNMNEFLNVFSNPSEESIIESGAYTLMSQYIFQIEQEMERVSMSKKTLAEKIGTSASYLSQFFNLNKIINFKTLAKIEKALDIKFELKNPNTNIINVENIKKDKTYFITKSLANTDNDSPHAA